MLSNLERNQNLIINILVKGFGRTVYETVFHVL